MSIIAAFPGGSQSFKIENGTEITGLATETIKKNYFVDVFQDVPYYSFTSTMPTYSGYGSVVTKISIDTTKTLLISAHINSGTNTIYLIVKIIFCTSTGVVTQQATKTLSFTVDGSFTQIGEIAACKFSSNLYLVALSGKRGQSWCIAPIVVNGTTISLGTVFFQSNWDSSSMAATMQVVPKSSTQFIFIHKIASCDVYLFNVSGSTITMVGSGALAYGFSGYNPDGKIGAIYSSSTSELAVFGYRGTGRALYYCTFKITSTTVTKQSDTSFSLSSWMGSYYSDYYGLDYIPVDTSSGIYLVTASISVPIVIRIVYNGGTSISVGLYGSCASGPYYNDFYYVTDNTTASLVTLHYYGDNTDTYVCTTKLVQQNSVTTLPQLGKFSFTTELGTNVLHGASNVVALGVLNGFLVFGVITFGGSGASYILNALVFKLENLIPSNAYATIHAASKLKNGISTMDISKNNYGTVIVPQ